MTYYFIGGLFNKEDINNKIKEHISFVSAFLVMITLIAVSILYEFIIGNHMLINSPEYHHDCPLIILTVCFIMLFFSYRNNYSKSNIIRLFSDATLGVYVLHGFVEMIINKLMCIDTFFKLILLWVFTVIISFVVSIVVNMIPYARILVNTRSKVPNRYL